MMFVYISLFVAYYHYYEKEVRMDERNMVKKMTQLSNMNVMILFILISFIALSVGLAFFFLVPGGVGYGVGIAMFVVAGLLFVIGEVNYFAKWRRIEMQQ